VGIPIGCLKNLRWESLWAERVGETNKKMLGVDRPMGEEPSNECGEVRGPLLDHPQEESRNEVSFHL